MITETQKVLIAAEAASLPTPPAMASLETLRFAGGQKTLPTLLSVAITADASITLSTVTVWMQRGSGPKMRLGEINEGFPIVLAADQGYEEPIRLPGGADGLGVSATYTGAGGVTIELFAQEEV